MWVQFIKNQPTKQKTKTININEVDNFFFKKRKISNNYSAVFLLLVIQLLFIEIQ